MHKDRKGNTLFPGDWCEVFPDEEDPEFAAWSGKILSLEPDNKCCFFSSFGPLYVPTSDLEKLVS